MELRFAERARATKDLDLGMEGPRANRLEALSQGLGLGFDQFTFRVKAQTRDMEEADTIRVSVAIQYRTRSWLTIEVDLGPANVGHVDQIEPRVRGLVELGIPAPAGARTPASDHRRTLDPDLRSRTPCCRRAAGSKRRGDTSPGPRWRSAEQAPIPSVERSSLAAVPPESGLSQRRGCPRRSRSMPGTQ